MDHGLTSTTPLTATSQFIEADNDDDFDEDDIPAFAHPSLGTQSPGGAKGKGRAAPEQLAPPSGAGQAPQGAGLSGNIGAPPTNGGPRAARQTVGGVQVETRYTGLDTLDEPVLTTIVSA
ncbi:hypothetical protein HWV62_15026 [Athelia sp. TMB]|nr:hypothetical protein HWV62_15026 [Athelia sp. TMB]